MNSDPTIRADPRSPLRHEHFGEGADLVLVHGLSASSRWWARNIEALSAHHRISAVDLAGFGGSRRSGRFRLEETVSMLSDWLDTHGIESAGFIGHSMGGLVAARLAAELPERVGRLVLVDAAFLAFDPGIRKTLRGLSHAIRRAPMDLRRLVARDGLRADPISLGRATVELLFADWQPVLAKIEAPTLIVWGEHDTLTPLTIGEQIAARIPNARLVVLPGAGHVPMWDQPAAFNSAVVAFLESPSTNDGPTRPT
jgi:pimeloyl-ACP methyl ester carboxylesterase